MTSVPQYSIIQLKRKEGAIELKTVNDVLYSRALSDMSSHVFVDGVCVKSRMLREEKPSIEEALATNQSVLVQTGRKIKIYVDDYSLEHYKRLISFISDEVAQGKHSFHTALLPLFKDGTIIIIKDGNKVNM